MEINEVTFDGATPIDSYGPGFFRVGGEVIEGAILVTVHGAREWGGYADPDPLRALADEIDVLLVGTGPETRHMPAETRARLEEAGLGVEAMNSPAAARTYNVLIAEGRRVAVALLPV